MTIRRIGFVLSIIAAIVATAPASAGTALTSEQLAVAIPGSTVDIFETPDARGGITSAVRYRFADDGTFTYYRETGRGQLDIERDSGTWRTASNRLCLDYDARARWNGCWIVEQWELGFNIVGKIGPIFNERQVADVFNPGFLSTDMLLAAVNAADVPLAAVNAAD